jgi:D-alanyl-D-alanine carboxypeptidase
MTSTRRGAGRSLMWVAIVVAATAAAAARAQAEALLLIEAASGRVLHAQNATQPWYPASVTKLMTAYVTLRAVKEGRLTLDHPITITANAASQAPVKMGFPPGTIVTIDNALKMLMVKSANDMAVVLAEGVAGSVENFADLMNRHARQLGMTQSSFVNPNGLPADDQVSSARDLAILARAIIRELPEYDYYWHLPGIRYGKWAQRNYNTLIGRYPGADGMKTGFICASGFNLVASATRDGRRLIAVVLGAPSAAARAMKAAQLLERGFNSSSGLGWLTPSMGTVEAMPAVDAAPPNLREEMCGAHRKRQAAENEDDLVASNDAPDSPYATFLASLRPRTKSAALLQEAEMGEPVLVFTGAKPPPPGTVQALPGEGKPKKKTATASVKPAAGKDATQDTATAATEGSKPKPKPKPVAAKDTATTAATTARSTGSSTATPAAATEGGKPKPKPAKDPAAAKDPAGKDAATAAPKPKPTTVQKPKPATAATSAPATTQAQ